MSRQVVSICFIIGFILLSGYIIHKNPELSLKTYSRCSHYFRLCTKFFKPKRKMKITKDHVKKAADLGLSIYDYISDEFSNEKRIIF